MSDSISWRWVDEPQGFAEMIEKLRGASDLAVDTESDSMHCYFEKVCLIQLATEDHAFLLDPLALPDQMGGLGGVLADPGVRKILHGADYDVVCLKRAFGFEIRNLFDTMVAAQCLGVEKFGLADLVREAFDVTLDKRFARTNWARRPLSEAELDYSYLDVKYLIELAGQLEARLVEADVIEEARIEFDRLTEREPASGEFDPDGYRRIRGRKELAAAGQAVLRELYLLRDRQARAMDRPPFKVIGNDTLLRIAQRRPRSGGQLKELKGVSDYVMRRHGKAILSAVSQGERRGKPPPPQPRKPKKPRLSPRQQRQHDELKDWRKERAVKRGIPHLVVLPNHALLEIVLTGPPDLESLGALVTVGEKRARLYGEEILAILADGRGSGGRSRP